MNDSVFSTIGKIMASLGGGAVLVFALSAWLGKLWAERIMRDETARHAKDLERMRATITENLEALRAKIAKAAFEFETRFARLHTTRAEVIADLFKKLVALHHAARGHLPGVISGKERQESFGECLKAARESFEHNEIYFDPTLCQLIENFLDKINYYDIEKTIDQETLIPGQPDPGRTERMRVRAGYVNDAMPELKKKLTDEFRRLLGVPHDASEQAIVTNTPEPGHD